MRDERGSSPARLHVENIAIDHQQALDHAASVARFAVPTKRDHPLDEEVCLLNLTHRPFAPFVFEDGGSATS